MIYNLNNQVSFKEDLDFWSTLPHWVHNQFVRITPLAPSKLLYWIGRLAAPLLATRSETEFTIVHYEAQNLFKRSCIWSFLHFSLDVEYILEIVQDQKNIYDPNATTLSKVS